MELDGALIGQIIYVRSEIKCDDGRSVSIMTFGPIGIAPNYKRQGYGKILLDFSMEKAKKMGASALAITGNIAFYGKSGFVPAKTTGVRYADDPEAGLFPHQGAYARFSKRHLRHLQRSRGVFYL